MSRRPKLAFILNVLNPGTGPYQRAIRISDSKFEVVIVSCHDSQSQLEDKVWALGVPVGEKRLVGLGEKRPLALAMRLIRWLWKERPEVISVNHSFSTAVSLFAARFCSVRAKVAFEGTLFSRYSRFKAGLLAWIHSFSDAVICNSQAAARVNASCELAGFHARRILITNGVPIREIDRAAGDASILEARLRLPETGRRILYVGDLKTVKDIPTLIRAYAEFVCEYADSLLILAGKGELRSALEEQCRKLNLEGKVLFTGQLERSEIYSLLHLVDAFVLPSRVEGMSEALAQAMCASLPVVVSDISPNLEAVRDGYNGCVFRTGDAGHLAKQLSGLFDRDNERQKLGDNARKVIEEKFDIMKIVESYEELYLSILERRKYRGGEFSPLTSSVKPEE